MPRSLPDVDIRFRQGLPLIFVLFFLPNLFVEGMIISGIDMNATSIRKGQILIICFFVQCLLVLVAIKKLGGINIGKLLYGKLPSFVEYVKWGIVGCMLGFIQFASHLRYGFRFEELGLTFVIFWIGGIILRSILWPLIEEPIYRGIIFVALYNCGDKNRLLAYIGSTFLFVVYHTPSYTNFFLHGILELGNLHLFLIISFSLISAYIYESTGKLLLCIWVHGIANAMEFIGALVGYLTDVAPPQ